MVNGVARHRGRKPGLAVELVDAVVHRIDLLHEGLVHLVEEQLDRRVVSRHVGNNLAPGHQVSRAQPTHLAAKVEVHQPRAA